MQITQIEEKIFIVSEDKEKNKKSRKYMPPMPTELISVVKLLLPTLYLRAGKKNNT